MSDRALTGAAETTGDDAGPFGLAHRLPEPALETLAREVLSRMARGPQSHTAPPLPKCAGVLPLCHSLISPDPSAAEAIVRKLQAAGAGLEQIYLHKLAPAARQLGTWWDENEASFAEVTIGISRIYALMRALRDAEPAPLGGGARRAIFAAVPGETHTLGVTMAADLFRREGWDVDLKIGLDHEALLASIAATGLTLIGLSTASERNFSELARLVLALRVSLPRCHILVSGRITEATPDLLSRLGIDAVADDVPTALAAMETLRQRALTLQTTSG